MRTVTIIGLADKGVFNTPTKIDNIKDLHTTFGKKSNIVSAAEQLIYEDHKPIIIRLEEDTPTAFVYLLDDNNDKCMAVYADSPGLAGSSTSLEIKRGNDTFSILVFNNGEMVEFWGNLQLDQINETINFASKWINVSLLKETLPNIGSYKLSTNNKCEKEINLEKLLEGLNCSGDTEFILIPDCNDFNKINCIINYLEEEKPNSILLIDPPLEYDIIETYKWCNQITPYDNAVVFWPWLKYGNKSIPPSASVLAAILKWPQPWKSTRVRLAGISGIVYDYDDVVYLSKQAHVLNILNKNKDYLFLDSNIKTIAGNKLSERILLNNIRSKVSKIGTDLLMIHSPVSYNFRNNFLESCGYILDQIKEDQGIINYNILVNELTQPKVFEVNIEVGVKYSSEIVNICFKFMK